MRRNGRYRARYRTSRTRAASVAIALVALANVQRAASSPADVFQIAAPVLGGDLPKAADIKAGDASVSTQTGALTYTYPIVTPPGRAGMKADLALTYSSHAPTYGSPVGAGWSLAIPEIREDVSQGRLATRHPQIENGQSDPRADDRFTSSMAGGSPLVKVTEPKGTDDVYAAYRAKRNDSTFTRYERMNPTAPFRWRAYGPDGKVYYFGESALTSSCSIVGEGYAPLTSIKDGFGNYVTFVYASLAYPDECVLSQIRYGLNPGVVADFVTIDFGYNRPPECMGIPSGSQIDYRSGRKIMTGGSRLDTITIKAHPPGVPGAPDHTRLITLGYSAADQNCSTTAQRSPVRLLTSIQESAWGTDSPRVDLPAILFSYGAAPVIDTVSTRSVPPWTSLIYPDYNPNLSWGFRYNDAGTLARWPTVEAMLVDIDGDGWLDRLQSEPVNTSGMPVTHSSPVASCRATWQRNRGPGQNFASPQNLQFIGGSTSTNFPRLKWSGTEGSPTTGEGCALNGQVTSYDNSHCNAQCAYGTCDATGHCNDGYECGCTQPPNVNPLTYLTYRWMDMDNDGLVDLVAAVHGRWEVYNIIHGNNIPDPGLEPTLSMLGYSGNWPDCPGQSSTCPQISSDDLIRNRTCNPVCDLNWSIVDGMIDSAPKGDCELQIGTYMANQNPEQGVPSGTPHVEAERVPYTRCNGLYPWFIYKNIGNGRFNSSPTIKYQPLPLESDNGDSSLVTGKVIGWTATSHGFIDIDGDGVPDAVARADDYDGSSGTHPFTWYVWRGDRTFGFEPTLGSPYLFTTPDFAAFSETSSTTGNQIAGFIDLQGDGLQEQWRSIGSPTNNANVAINDGLRLRTTFDMLINGLPAGEINTPSIGGTGVYPGVMPEDVIDTLHGQYPALGHRYSFNRPIDVDGDGRVDILQRAASFTTAPLVYFNLGGQFQPPPSTSFPVNSVVFEPSTHFGRQTVYAHYLGAQPADYYWQVKHDLIDLDGDGVLEAIRFNDSGTSMRTSSAAASNSPSRLMTQINPQRGAVTTIAYDSMHSSTVEQNPSTIGADGRPKATPTTQWVVKSLTATDSIANTTSVTSYFYKNPRHGADDEGKFAFRGFEEVTTTASSGAKTIQRFAFSPDWSGRLATTLVVPAEAPGEVRSIDESTWESRTLFGGAVTTYHTTVKDHWACKNGQNETACRANTDTRTRTVSTLVALPSTIGPDFSTQLLWQEAASRSQTGIGQANGDRVTTTSFAVAANATSYRVRPVQATKQEQQSGSLVLVAKSATGWDSLYLTALTEEVWNDALDGNRSITRREYDSTGNVTKVWKPKQWAANPNVITNLNRTTLTYDARKLFAVNEVNEVGHVRDFTFEYGTGTKLMTLGPNAPLCSLPQPHTCPSGEPLKEETRSASTASVGRSSVTKHSATTGTSTGATRSRPTSTSMGLILVQARR